MLRYSFGNIDGKAYGLNANELSVYEAIGKCSRKDDARGWYADLQTLADQLPHRIGRVTVSRAVDKLLTLGLIRRDGKSLFVCVQNERAHVQNEQNGVQNEQNGVQNEQKSTPPLYPPINNNNKMEKENTRTCVPTHDTAEPKTPSFKDLMDAFKSKGGKVNNYESGEAMDAWLASSFAKRTKLLAAVCSGAHFKPRLDWLIADFPEPQPEFLRGDEPGRIVQVRYNGMYKLCTPETMKLFGLEYVQIWK